MNRPPSLQTIAHAEREIAVTYLTPERFAAKPQIGIALSQEWHSFLRWLTWPSVGPAKASFGAWCPTALARGIVKDGSGQSSLLVADVDECDAGAIERSVALCASCAGAIIPTFSATLEKPKHRIVLLLDRALSAEEFPVAWRKMARRLESAGVVVDKGCKNINRLYFACVVRSPEAWLGAHILPGKPLPVDSMLAVARAEETEAARIRDAARARAAVAPSPTEHDRHSAYLAAAAAAERANIAGAGEGGRHEALLRAAYALARFDISEVEIERELLPVFVVAAGEPRRHEGERAIRDAVVARRRELSA